MRGGKILSILYIREFSPNLTTKIRPALFEHSRIVLYLALNTLSSFLVSENVGIPTFLDAMNHLSLGRFALTLQPISGVVA